MLEETPLGLVTAALEYGSKLSPVSDHSPSSCIESAWWLPGVEMIYLTLTDGTAVERSCDLATWTLYKMAPSKGRFFNQMWR